MPQAQATEIVASSVEEVYHKVEKLRAGDTLLLDDGVYKDIKLIINHSGTPGKHIVVRAKNGGKVFFTGDAKVELRGQYIVLQDIYFKDGNRDRTQWKSHGPGLVALYNSYNRITGCVFHAFDEANSAYITTSIPESGKVPQHCRIDHCVFTDKVTFDQVINLNNRTKAEKTAKEEAVAMYHRIDHCFFSNPQKPGNAGGGIRIGYYRNDVGRCLVDSNLFVRQDSEPEIITSKSQENIYYANTFLNCQGTLNFRHGDNQIALNNFFISTDNLFGYGGMFIWGSGHTIAGNYFRLNKTLNSRGNAALYLNPGPEASEHALAFNIQLLNNVFDDNNGYAINFEPLIERRKEFSATSNLPFKQPYAITISGNVFKRQQYNFPVFLGSPKESRLSNNYAVGYPEAENSVYGMLRSPKNNEYYPVNYKSENYQVKNIDGIPLKVTELVNTGIKGKPLTWEEVKPLWLDEIPSEYYKKAELSSRSKAMLTRVIHQTN
ncbi:chondroitinase-B domain-containing protein [Pseudopedobacter beijingensis]|uniref:Chondroitinase-B domain-containing protein n=1 Tax=Pseudopedobacter beijingensis TaxID=1207056 RepID=A0ABW4IDK6_9SPHI